MRQHNAACRRLLNYDRKACTGKQNRALLATIRIGMGCNCGCHAKCRLPSHPASPHLHRFEPGQATEPTRIALQRSSTANGVVSTNRFYPVRAPQWQLGVVSKVAALQPRLRKGPRLLPYEFLPPQKRLTRSLCNGSWWKLGFGFFKVISWFINQLPFALPEKFGAVHQSCRSLAGF